MKRKNILLFGMVFLMGILLLSVVSAVSLSSSSSSFSRSNPNYGLLNQYVTDGPSSSFDSKMCEAGQDFVLQIAPFSCTPAVVRSDLLEEQNVPVFCPIAATQINPLIDVKAVESISFSGDYPREISGVGFHPAQAALGTTKKTNYPILENIGYAVIILKKQPNESAMPEFVSGNLTAKIKYDINNAFGIGNALFYLPEMSENEFEQVKEQYGFWKGRAYLRAERVEDDYATIAVYNDQRKISSVTLEPGKISNKISVPGFDYCRANLQLKLDSLDNPGTTAKLDINGEIVEIVEGQKFLDNNCEVTKIDRQGLVQKVKILCYEDDGRNSFELRIVPKVRIKVGDTESDVGVGDSLIGLTIDSIDTSKKDSSNKEDLVVTLKDASGNKYKLGYSKLQTISNTEFKLIGFAGSQNSEFKNSNVKLNYEKAMQDYDAVIDSFSNEQCADFKDCGEKAFIEKMELVYNTKQGQTLVEICKEFDERYPKSTKKPGFCNDVWKLSSTEPSSVQVLINGELRDISLVKIVESDESEYSANITIETDMRKVQKYYDEELKKLKEKLGSEAEDNLKDIKRFESYDKFVKDANYAAEFLEKTLTKDIFERIKELEKLERDINAFKSSDYKKDAYTLGKNKRVDFLAGFVQLKELRKDSAVFFVGPEGETQSKTVTVKLGESYSAYNYRIFLDKVNMKKYAKVSVMPNIDNAYSVGNFSFSVGIEKRAIQLSPEKIQTKLDSLNETITKWEEKSENLGEMVKTLKGACLATSGFLLAKNFLFNQGESLARKDVMEVWNKKCTDLINDKEYLNFDRCYADNSDEIDKAVKARANVMEGTSDKFGNIQKGIAKPKWAGLESEVPDDELWNKIEEDSNFLEPTVKNLGKCYGEDTIEIQGKKVSVSGILNDKTAKSDYLSIYDLRDIMVDAEFCNAGYGDIARERLDKNLKTLYVNSRTPVERDSFAKEFGLDSDDVSVVARKDVNEYAYTGKTYADIKNKVTIKEVGDNNPVASVLTTDGKRYFAVLEQNGNKYVVKNLYDSKGAKVNDDIKAVFVRFDKNTYSHPFKASTGDTVPVVRYFETEPHKGLPAVVPFDLKNGWYVYVTHDAGFGRGEASYDDSGAVRNYYICNVGEDETEDGMRPDDSCRGINKGTGELRENFYGMDEKGGKKLVKCAEDAIIQASRGHGKKTIDIRTSCGNIPDLKVGNPMVDVPDMQCQNFMSPKDCQILFNVCDPVICPSSRCNFGGSFPVQDVIQSGIVGSIMLCLPNFGNPIKGGVLIPVCLTGLKAGIDGLLSVYKSYRDCLQESLNTGKTVGICDEIYSIHLCEFMWRQALPLAKYSVPKIIEALLGQSTRGGGEYFKFRNALNTADNSVTYFTQYYAANSFKAFKLRSAEEVGTEVCKNFVSGVGPKISSMIDSFTEPDSPAQFHGRFDEIPFTSATVPPTSQYKVFYHIYAGDDARAYYSVYLEGSPESSYYQDSTYRRVIESGYIGAGEYVSKTEDFLAPSGYKKMCIRVNEYEECGFKEVSTSFAVNYLKDQYVKSQATEKNVGSEGECVSGTINFGQVVAGALSPNVQEGADDILNPKIYDRGIIRICAHDNPGVGTDGKAGGEGSRWTEVGYCDQSKGIKCWLDTNSVENVIRDTQVEAETLSEADRNYMNILRKDEKVSGAETKLNAIQGVSKGNANSVIGKINDLIGDLIMNRDRARALMLRAKAYSILAGDKVSEGVKTQVETKSEVIAKKKTPEKEQTQNPKEECDGYCNGIDGSPGTSRVVDKEYDCSVVGGLLRVGHKILDSDPDSRCCCYGDEEVEDVVVKDINGIPFEDGKIYYWNTWDRVKEDSGWQKEEATFDGGDYVQAIKINSNFYLIEYAVDDFYEVYYGLVTQEQINSYVLSKTYREGDEPLAPGVYRWDLFYGGITTYSEDSYSEISNFPKVINKKFIE